MELEYRITHSYIDKFSRPFERNQIKLEKFNKQVEKSVSLFDRIKLDKSFNLSLNSRSFYKQIDTVKRNLQKEGVSLINWKTHLSPPKLETLESSIDWHNNFKEPTVPKLSSHIEWKNKFSFSNMEPLGVPINWKNELKTSNKSIKENKYELSEAQKLTEKSGIGFIETSKISKNFSTNLKRSIQSPLQIETKLEAKKLFKETKISLHKIQKSIERNEPKITPKIDDSKIQKQLEDIKKEISKESIMSSISIGFGLNQLKDQLKEEGLSLSEALYESTKYGLKKTKLAYNIAQEVNKTGGYIDATEIGNNIVSALRQGVRGSEKELAYFGTVMAKFQKAFDVSAEEIGGIIYNLQRFKIPTREFEKILGFTVALRKDFNITSERMKEIMQSIDDEFGFLMNSMDKNLRGKFIVNMEKFSAALENSYVDSKNFMDILAGAVEGDTQKMQQAFFLTGMSVTDLQKALQKGDTKTIYDNLLKRAKELYKQYGKLSPMAQKAIAESLGIDPKQFQQILEMGKNEKAVRRDFQKAFRTKPEDPMKVIKNSTNMFTKYMTIFKNKLIGLSSSMGEGFLDTVSGIFDLASSPLGAIATAKLGSFLYGKIKESGFNILGNFAGKIAGKEALSETIPAATEGIGIASKLGNLASKAGYGIALFETAKILTAKDKVMQTGKAAGSWAGAWGGTELGAAIGTAIAPGIGTAIGAALGGLAGAFAGTKAGGWLTEKIRSIFSSPKVKPQQEVQTIQKLQRQSSDIQETQSATEKAKRKNEEISNEEKLLAEIRDNLLAIQAIMTKFYQQKLLAPEGVPLPSIDPFEQWRKS